MVPAAPELLRGSLVRHVAFMILRSKAKIFEKIFLLM
jgi:hypothetical protein